METLMKMKWKIGSVEIENPFILAPMAGVTDLPFRILCKEQGADRKRRKGPYRPGSGCSRLSDTDPDVWAGGIPQCSYGGRNTHV